MYARTINGNIKTMDNLPSKFKGKYGNYAGEFHKLSSEIHLREGFKPLIIPIIDKPRTYKLGSITEFEDRYEYDLTPIYPNITLEEAKAMRIEELKHNADQAFNKSQWYYDREIRTSKMNNRATKNTPDHVIENDNLIYSEYDSQELAINELTLIDDVLEFDAQIDLPIN